MSRRPGSPDPAGRGHLLRWLRRFSLRRTRSTPRSALLAASHLTPSRRTGREAGCVLTDGLWGALGPKRQLALLLAGGVAWLVCWNAPTAVGGAEAARTQMKETAEGAEQRISKILAKGNVRIVRGEQTATAQEAVYLREEEKIILTGDAKVWEGPNMVTGRQITLFLDEDASLVEQEVKVIFYPKQQEAKGAAPPGKPAREKGPVVITAAKMRADHREKTVTFEQEVVVRREETTLYADHVTVIYQ